MDNEKGKNGRLEKEREHSAAKANSKRRINESQGSQGRGGSVRAISKQEPNSVCPKIFKMLINMVLPYILFEIAKYIFGFGANAYRIRQI